MSAALSVQRVSKHHGTLAALRDVSLAVSPGTIHGLVGGNGAGKSTLVRILAGVSRADPGGTVHAGDHVMPADRVTPAWSAAAGLRFVHQNLGVFLDMTVAENLVIGHGFATARSGRIRWPQVHRNAAAVLERFGIDAAPGQMLGQLRAPDRTLVAIARALQDRSETSPRTVILDEPTACLPLAEATRLLDAIRRLADDGHSIVLISHRLDEIVRVADRVSVLRDGCMVDTLERDDLSEGALIELISGDALDTPIAASRREGVPSDRRAPVMEVRELSAGPLHNVSFAAGQGEILGVAGLLGSGRSRLLRALFGADAITTGSVHIDGHRIRLRDIGDALAAGIAYVPEDRAREAVFADMTVRENLTAGQLSPFWTGLRLSRRAEAIASSHLLERFQIRVTTDQQPIATLSGGNQQKAVLARMLATTPRVMLLDEPSQGVDVHARAEIHRLIRRAVQLGATAVIVSSDFEELVSICDRVIVLRHGQVVEELIGPEITTARMHHAAFGAVKETA